MFTMYQPNANKRICFLHPLLNAALGDIGELPERKAESLYPEDDERKFFMHDGTERPIVRPKNKNDRKIETAIF